MSSIQTSPASSLTFAPPPPTPPTTPAGMADAAVTDPRGFIPKDSTPVPACRVSPDSPSMTSSSNHKNSVHGMLRAFQRRWRPQLPQKLRSFRQRRKPRTPHLVTEAPWAPANLETQIEATLTAPWKLQWWLLYADTVSLRCQDNNSSIAVYRAINCWGDAASIEQEERLALFRCYHDDAAAATFGYTDYGESMWALCRDWEGDKSCTSPNLGVCNSRTW